MCCFDGTGWHSLTRLFLAVTLTALSVLLVARTLVLQRTFRRWGRDLNPR